MTGGRLFRGRQREAPTAAYVIPDIAVQDPVGHEEHKRLAGPSIQRDGGRSLVRGGPVERLGGEWKPTRLVILEFDSADQARRWYASPEYERAKPVRGRTARTDLVIVEAAVAAHGGRGRWRDPRGEEEEGEEEKVARASTKILDSGDGFPALAMQTVNHGPLKLPDWFEGGWGIVLLYRGHW